MGQTSAKPATAATVNGLRKVDQLGRQIDFLAKPHSFRTQSNSYQASPIKRVRATKDEVAQRRQALFDIVAAMKPMTVRQVFYQATVRNIIEKTEAGYTKVQTDLVLMRRSGLLPYDWLADNTRWQRKPRTFNGVEEALNDTVRLYRKSLWAGAEFLRRGLA